MGSEYWPHTPEGRILCVLLALYSLGVLGYITASLASFFVGRDAGKEEGADDNSIRQLRDEIAALRQELRDARRPPGSRRRRRARARHLAPASGDANAGAKPEARREI